MGKENLGGRVRMRIRERERETELRGTWREGERERERRFIICALFQQVGFLMKEPHCC